MNIFSVGDGKEYELTRENFILNCQVKCNDISK